MTTQACANCAFGLSADGDHYGITCRRYPPTVVWATWAGGDRYGWEHAYPYTARADWCGEWQPATNEDAQAIRPTPQRAIFYGKI